MLVNFPTSLTKSNQHQLNLETISAAAPTYQMKRFMYLYFLQNTYIYQHIAYNVSSPSSISLRFSTSI